MYVSNRCLSFFFNCVMVSWYKFCVFVNFFWLFLLIVSDFNVVWILLIVFKYVLDLCWRFFYILDCWVWLEEFEFYCIIIFFVEFKFWMDVNFVSVFELFFVLGFVIWYVYKLFYYVLYLYFFNFLNLLIIWVEKEGLFSVNWL